MAAFTFKGKDRHIMNTSSRWTQLGTSLVLVAMAASAFGAPPASAGGLRDARASRQQIETPTTDPTPTPTDAPTDASAPTDTPASPDTPTPTETPTDTPVPSDTPAPSETATPTATATSDIGALE